MLHSARFIALGLLFSLACEAGSSGTGNSSSVGGSGGEGGVAQSGGSGGVGPTSGGSTSDGGSGGTGAGFDTGGGGSGYEGVPEVFGHSKDTLYVLDPETKEVGVVGPFVGCTLIQDIALDKESKIYGASATGLYLIDKESAECTLIAEGAYPNSLSFVPAGTLDEDRETLVGFLADQYVRINVETGAITNVGSPWGNSFVSSGDVVSVKNGPTYLTIKDEDPNDNVCKDCLVQIDPKTGGILQNYGTIGYGKVFGAAFWAGSVYGFTSLGELFEIVIENGQLDVTLIDAPKGLSFWGAGSTTSAPPVPE